MSAQITLGQDVRLNRALRVASPQPGEDVNDQLPLVFWRNDYWRLKREARTPSAIRALLAQGVDNLFAAQAIGNVLKSKIYSGILPRVVDG
jgi:hypothetical protein